MADKTTEDEAKATHVDWTRNSGERRWADGRAAMGDGVRTGVQRWTDMHSEQRGREGRMRTQEDERMRYSPL